MAVSDKHVAILLCTYNGQKYLSDQLDSIESQNHPNWSLYVSDDGSTDATKNILNEYKNSWSKRKIVLIDGPKKGFCHNFLSLACNQNINADYYAYCDQDDIWLPNKLSAALNKLISRENESVANLYCGRTRYVDGWLNPCGKSPLFQRLPSFENALVQSIAGGNTMVFNHTAKKVIESVGAIDTISHDWWTYQLISGAGGVVSYDPLPYVLYRQHSGALIGGNRSILSKFKRLKLLSAGSFKAYTDATIRSLGKASHFLTDQNRTTLKKFEESRSMYFFERLTLMNKIGIHRQKLLDNFVLVLLVLFKKF
ncbi:glycosyltransferase family 2 protein [Polynucleobacter paneuropaeus]|nr:glycosyltransferase family 2 protein [Polynucleobacter paneuropaeus]